MHARVFADLRHYSRDAASDDLLRIRLPRVDHVVDLETAAKVRPLDTDFRFGFRIGGGDPECVAVVVMPEIAVMKIEPELTEFPELIRDVFAGVSDSAVGTHDDLV